MTAESIATATQARLRAASAGVLADLVGRARAGDKQAWDALVERYAPLIWSICGRYGLARHDADDVGQTVWLHLVDQLDKVREPAALPGWISTAARWECARVLRAQRRDDAGYGPDAEDIPDAQAVEVDRELLAAERRAVFRQAFAELPPFCQRLLTLLMEDPPEPYTEISARLRIPVGSIGPNRRRCLDRLRRDPAVAALIGASG